METARGKQGSHIVLGILLVASALSINSIVSPILSEITVSFPDVSSAQIQVIYSIVGLLGIPIVLLGGKFSNKVSRKRMILCAFLLMITGGLLGFFGYKSIKYLYIASAITGGGLSLAQVMLFSTIAINFNGEGRAKWGGISGAVFSIAGSIYTIISGSIAENIGWRNSYLIILWVIPLCLLAMKFLPDELPAAKVNPSVIRSERRKKPGFCSFRYILYTVLGFIAMISFTAYNTNISLFTMNMGFGGAIAASRASSFFLLAGIPAGFLCGMIFRKTKNHYMTFAAFLFCVGFFVCAWSNSLLMLCIGSAIIGFANGIRVPGNTVVLGEMLPAEDTTLGFGIYNSISLLGGFLSPYMIALFADLTGNNPRIPYFICVIILIIMTVGHFIDAEVLNTKYKKTEKPIF